MKQDLFTSAWAYLWAEHPRLLSLAIAVPLTIDTLILTPLLDGGLLYQLFVLVWLPLFYLYGYGLSKVRQHFWRTVAQRLQWVYQGKDAVEDERALFLTQGSDRHIENMIVGIYEGMRTRVFESYFTTGSGKNKTRHNFTAVAFSFAGVFPHCYLNSRSNYHNQAALLPQPILLPAAFEKLYELYAPPDYEIEVLEIFSQENLAYLSSNAFSYDVELVGSELIVMQPAHVYSLDAFESLLDKSTLLAKRFRPVLERMHVAQIGDRPYFLTQDHQPSIMFNAVAGVLFERVFGSKYAMWWLAGIVATLLGMFWLSV